ncbi:MAG: hypothetical protein ACF8CY_05300, partial [Gimesia chilikensis]
MNLSPHLARWGLFFSVLSAGLLLDCSVSSAQYQRTLVSGEAEAVEKAPAAETKSKPSAAEQAIRKVAVE